MEDIDAIIDNYNESKVLNILDGAESIENMVFLASTNYPERLGPRIINRPSRFDKRFKIGFPSAEARLIYFQHLFKNIKDHNIELEKWVGDTEEFSIAHLKELFIAVMILGDSYEEAINLLQSMKEEVSSDRDEDSDFGFTKSKRRSGWSKSRD